MRNPLRITLVLAMSSTALAACGGGGGKAESAGSGGKTVAQVAQYSGSDRQSFLEQCAAKEGSVTVYTAQNTDLWEPMRKAFQDKYPNIKVATTRRTSAQTAEAVVQEANARADKVDVVDVKVEVAASLLDQFTPIKSSEMAAYPAQAVGKDSKFVTTDRIPYGVIYNTDKVSAADAPKTSQDLLNPKWKGKIAMSTTLLGTQWVGAMVHLYGDDFIKQFGKQAIKTTSANTDAIAAQVAAGESWIAPGINLSGVQALSEGGKTAPVKWLPIDSQWTEGAISLAAKAPHPCAGMLYIDFELSKAGQQLNPLYLSSRTDLPPNKDLAGIEPMDIWTIVGSRDVDAYQKASKHWTDLIDQNILTRK